MAFLRVFACLVLCMLAVPGWAGRKALVIGNADYESLAQLGNTHADAQGYAQTFGALGFEVTFLTDLDEAAMEEAVISFVDGIVPGDEVAFVYAGHGWSTGGVNYLIPVDAPRKASARLLARRSMALKNGVSGVLDEIAAQGAGFSLAIVDACRDNPFEGAGTRGSGSRGLARIAPNQGSFVIYSAGEGQAALDRLESDTDAQTYSVFTRHFLPLLKSPLYLEDAVIEAQAQTARAAQAQGHLQIPAVYRQKLGKTCLHDTCSTQSAAPPPEPVAPKPVVSGRGGWAVEHLVTGAIRINAQDAPSVAPDGSFISDAHSLTYYKDGKFERSELFVTGYDAVGQVVFAHELDGTAFSTVASDGQGRLITFDYDGFRILGRDGEFGQPRGYLGGDLRYVAEKVALSETKLRIFGVTGDGLDAPFSVFDLDLETGALGEPLMTVPKRPDHMKLSSTGHFAWGSYNGGEIHVHGPDGAELFRVDPKTLGARPLTWTLSPFGLYVFFQSEEQQGYGEQEITLLIRDWAGRETRNEIRLTERPIYATWVRPSADANGLALSYRTFENTRVERFDLSGAARLWATEIPGDRQGYVPPWNLFNLADGGTMIEINKASPISNPTEASNGGLRLIRIGAKGEFPEPG